MWVTIHPLLKKCMILCKQIPLENLAGRAHTLQMVPLVTGASRGRFLRIPEYSVRTPWVAIPILLPFIHWPQSERSGFRCIQRPWRQFFSLQYLLFELQFRIWANHGLNLHQLKIFVSLHTSIFRFLSIFPNVKIFGRLTIWQPSSISITQNTI